MVVVQAGLDLRVENVVRQASAATSVLLSVSLAVHGDWAGLALSGVGSIAAGLTLLLCWR